MPDLGGDDAAGGLPADGPPATARGPEVGVPAPEPDPEQPAQQGQAQQEQTPRADAPAPDLPGARAEADGAAAAEGEAGAGTGGPGRAAGTERDLSSAARALAAMIVTERPKAPVRPEPGPSAAEPEPDPEVGPEVGSETRVTFGGIPAARVALVTGAGRGIGRAIALGLARAGVSVALLGRSPGALDEVAAEVAAHGVGTSWAGADVRDYEQVQNALARLEAALGDIDLLVNNAGVIEPVEVPVWDAGPETWWHVVETDLRGPFHCVRAAVPAMLERGGGRVVNINSGVGAADRDVYSAYSAAKAGLFRITGSLHQAGYARGIRAFDLAPGVVRTDMTTAMAMHTEREDWTPVEAVVDLVIAVSQGRLDAWSGRYLRAGTDTPDSLDAAEVTAGEDGLPDRARRLGIMPYGPADPLA